MSFKFFIILVSVVTMLTAKQVPNEMFGIMLDEKIPVDILYDLNSDSLREVLDSLTLSSIKIGHVKDSLEYSVTTVINEDTIHANR